MLLETLLGCRGVAVVFAVCSWSLNCTQRRIRHVWHQHRKHSLALSNWIVNYHFYVQFKKYPKGHAAPETCCKTKFLLLVVWALTFHLEAVPYSMLLLRRQTEGRDLFCSHTCWTMGCSESWHVPHSQREVTECSWQSDYVLLYREDKAPLTGLYSFIHSFKAYIPYSIHPSTCPRDQAVQAHCIFSLCLFWLG